MANRSFKPTPAFLKKEEQLRQTILLEGKEKLRNDVQTLYRDDQCCDLMLVSESKEMAVHSFILEARFPLLHKYCLSEPESSKIYITGLQFVELERWIQTLYSQDSLDFDTIAQCLALKKTKSKTQEQADVGDSSLSTDLLSLLNESRTADVEFSVDGKTIKAHKAILAARCDYFAAMFSASWKEASLSNITIPDVCYEIFLAILKFIYGASQDVLSFPAFKILRLADMYGLQGLVDLIMLDLKITKCHLFHKPCAYCIPQVYECFKLCEAYYLAKKLQLQCVRWISKNFEKTLACRQFPHMSEYFKNEVKKEILKQMSRSTAALMFIQCKSLIASLENFNTCWTQAVVSFVQDIHEQCLDHTVENFAALCCDLPTIAILLKNTNNSFLNEVLERLTITNCCNIMEALQKIVSRVMGMREDESHFCNPFSVESFEVIQDCLKRCEKFIIGRIGPVSRTKAWQNIPLSKQQQLRSCGSFVDV